VAFILIPYISVLISCYNYEKYILRCLESCKRQAFKDFNVIIVDDASTDDSKDIINCFINDNPDLDVTFARMSENSGPGAAKGKALSFATGEYVIFVDCDDWMDDNCLSVLAKRAELTRADKIRAQARVKDEETGKVTRERVISKNPSTWCEGMMYATLIKRSVITDNNIRFHKSRSVSDDLYFIACVNSCVSSTEYVRETVYNISYKRDSDSGLARFDYEKKIKYAFETNKAVKGIYDKLDEKNKTLCEYLFAKQYYFLLLQYVRAVGFSEISNYHKGLRKTIDPFFPKFYNNKSIRLFQSGDPFFFQSVVWICSLAEKLRFMTLMLKIYWLVSRKIKFITR